MSRKRISKDNTFVVAILTESGAPFIEEGVDWIHNWLAEDRPELKDKAIIAMMGDMVHKPDQLASVLEAHPEAYIIVSYDGGEYLSRCRYSKENVLPVIEELRKEAIEDPKVTSWKIFSYILDGKE